MTGLPPRDLASSLRLAIGMALLAFIISGLACVGAYHLLTGCL